MTVIWLAVAAVPGGARGAGRTGRSWGPRNARGSSLAGRLHSKELSFIFQDQTCAIIYVLSLYSVPRRLQASIRQAA